MSKLYQEVEPSIVRHDNKDYSLNILLRIAHTKEDLIADVETLKWLLPHTLIDEGRVDLANSEHPLLITDYKGTYVVLDGVHRLAKAVREGDRSINVRYITPGELEIAKISNHTIS